MIEKADVLVIGGGPAGATAAFQLATAGVDVMLVDRAAFPREKTCGESVSPGALARLRTIGMWRPGTEDGVEPGNGAPDSMVVRGMRIRSPGGTAFLGRYKAGTNGAGLVIRRRVLDHELLASARARGVRVVERIEVVGGETTLNGETVLRARTTGSSAFFQIAARRVVVADGRQSFLARELGFLRSASARGQRRYAVRAHCEGVSDLSELAEMHVGQGGYCGLAPLSNTTANVCYVLFSDHLDMAPQTMEADFRRHLDGFPDVVRRFGTARVQGGISVVGPLRLPSRRHFRGPFIACGDTTGFLDPFTGEGIAHAVASGVLGARAIRRSLDGIADSFTDYQREVQDLRRVKGMAALLLYGLVSHRALANSAASVFARLPRLGDAVVQLFGDQV